MILEEEKREDADWSVELVRKSAGGTSAEDADRLAHKPGHLPLALNRVASPHTATGMPPPTPTPHQHRDSGLPQQKEHEADDVTDSPLRIVAFGDGVVVGTRWPKYPKSTPLLCAGRRGRTGILHRAASVTE